MYLNSSASLLKTLLIFSVALFAFFAFAIKIEAATLSISPGTGVYNTGSTFTARIVVNTEGKPINAAEGTVTFNPAELTVLSVAKGSIFGLWPVEPSFSNTAGTVTFGGGSPSGYTGSAGTILSITYRVKGAGTSKVAITRGSVLAADGLGTNVLRSQGGASYTLSAASTSPEPEVVIEYVAPANTPPAPEIESTTHPDPELWYTQVNADLNWSLPSGVQAIRTLLDSSASTIPTKVYDTPISSISLADLDEGINYFHIQLKNSDGWGKVAHYRLAIDTEKPRSFIITTSSTTDSYNPTPTLHFDVDDETSPVVRFKIILDGGEAVEYVDKDGTGLYTFPVLAPGAHTVAVEAFDGAGNSIVSTYTFIIDAFGKPVFTEYPPRLRDAVIPVIKGTTKPNSEVTVTFTKLGVTESSSQSDVSYTVHSSSEGEFVVIPDGVLGLGVYELSAVAIDEHGAQSTKSDVVRIVVEEAGFVRIAGVAVTVLSLLIPLVALCVLFALGIFYSHRHITLLRRRASKETHEAEDALKQAFARIYESLESETQELQSGRKTGKLTKSEQNIFDTLLAALQKAESSVSKEIHDIDDSLTT